MNVGCSVFAQLRPVYQLWPFLAQENLPIVSHLGCIKTGVLGHTICGAVLKTIWNLQLAAL